LAQEVATLQIRQGTIASSRRLNMMRVLLLMVVASVHADPDCHPLDQRTFKLWVRGYDGVGGDLRQWLSFDSDEHYLWARYGKESDAMPLSFKAVPGKCHQYILHDNWEGSQGMYEDRHWVSFHSCGKWLSDDYGMGDAMPILFKPLQDARANGIAGPYKMQNKWSGEDKWVSYTSSLVFDNCGGRGGRRYHDYYAIRAIYSEADAMLVDLYEQESDMTGGKGINALHEAEGDLTGNSVSNTMWAAMFAVVSGAAVTVGAWIAITRRRNVSPPALLG